MNPLPINRSKLFDRKPVPVMTDIFLHNLAPGTLEALHEALDQGLTPSGLDFTGDGGSIAILRFNRPRDGQAASVRYDGRG